MIRPCASRIPLATAMLLSPLAAAQTPFRSAAGSARGASFSRRPAHGDRGHRQGLPGRPSRSVAGGDGRARQAAEGGRCREGARDDQGQQRHALFNSPHQVVLGNPQGNVTSGRVLRLQLRLLQARAARHAHAAQDRSQSQIRAQGIPGARRRLGRSRACRGRRAHAGPDRQEIHRVPPEAARRPRAGRQGARARGRQGSRLRHGPAREGHGQRRGEDHDRREHEARRRARRQRHAELRGRRRGRGRRRRPRRAEGEDRGRTRNKYRSRDLCGKACSSLANSERNGDVAAVPASPLRRPSL